MNSVRYEEEFPWKNSEKNLPRPGDTIVIPGAMLSVFTIDHSRPEKLRKEWKATLFPRGTFIVVLLVHRFSDIVPSEKGSIWRVLIGEREELISVKDLMWRKV